MLTGSETSGAPIRLSILENPITPYITPESVANFSLSTLMAFTLAGLTMALDVAGYAIHHKIENEPVNLSVIVDDSYIPKVGSLVFGLCAWLVFFNTGLGTALDHQENEYELEPTYSHWKARAAVATIFVIDTLLGFAIDHFFLRHSSTYRLEECVFSKLASIIIAACLCVVAHYSGFNKFLIERLSGLHQSIHDRLVPYIGVGTDWQENTCGDLLTSCYSGFYSSSASKGINSVASIDIDPTVTECLLADSESGHSSTPTFRPSNSPLV